MKVKIISDSTSDLSPELVKKYDISIVPLYVVMGDKIRKDGIEATPEDIYEYVSQSGKLPKSAQVFADGAPNRTLVFDDAKKALEELGRMGITHVLCEGGLKLARSLADQGLVDQWLAVVAPKVIGSRPVEDVLCGKVLEDGSVRVGDDILVNVYFGD